MDASQGPNGAQGILIRLRITGPGVLLVAGVALGLASFVTWQLRIAIRDPQHRHDLDQRSRRVIRVGHLFSGAPHSVLVIEAMRILFGLGGTARGERAEKEWVAQARLHAQSAIGVAGALGTLRQQAYAEWILGTMAVGLMTYGLWQIVKEPYRRLSDS